MADFAPGDTVVLKSGGPEMTIRHVDRKRGAQCEWFAGATLKKADFKPEMLRPSKRGAGITFILESPPDPAQQADRKDNSGR